MSFLKQNEEPIFDEIFWTRPERASLAGKLIVVGGNRDSLKAPLLAFESAKDSNIGKVSVYLPDVLRKQLGNETPGLHYLGSTPSGGIAKSSLASLLESGNQYDALLLAGDFARSSETTQLLEEVCLKYSEDITITGDAIDVLLPNVELINASNICLVLNPGQMQKLVAGLGSVTAYSSSMPLEAFSELLGELSKNILKASVVTLHNGHVWVCSEGQISATKRNDIKNEAIWQVEQAARTACFLIQHTEQKFQALTSSAFIL